MIALLASVLLAVGAQESPFEIPENDGWVTDLGDMLSAEEESSLETLMESYRAGTTHEIALLTVPDLQGRPIEEFALAVARTWGIGGKEENNGALLVVSRDDRELRIEVGRGLEGNLTDAISGRIIRNVIAPEFKEGRFYVGIRSGIEAIHAAIGGDYGPIERGERGEGKAGGIACFFLLLMLLILFRSSAGRGVRRGGLGGVLPWLILASMSQGRGHAHRGGGGGGFRGFGGGGGGFGGFGGGGGFSGGGASGSW